MNRHTHTHTQLFYSWISNETIYALLSSAASNKYAPFICTQCAFSGFLLVFIQFAHFHRFYCYFFCFLSFYSSLTFIVFHKYTDAKTIPRFYPRTFSFKIKMPMQCQFKEKKSFKIYFHRRSTRFCHFGNKAERFFFGNTNANQKNKFYMK